MAHFKEGVEKPRRALSAQRTNKGDDMDTSHIELQVEFIAIIICLALTCWLLVSMLYMLTMHQSKLWHRNRNVLVIDIVIKSFCAIHLFVPYLRR